MQLDVGAGKRALVGRVAKPLGLEMTRAADGILQIAATAMSYAVKGVTTERGLDAGDFALIAYGGAGPLHAVEIAREIGIRTVIVPMAPGLFSAFGMLFSDLRYDFVRTWFTRLEDAAFDAIEKVYRELERQGREGIAGTSAKPRAVAVKRAADMRYVGQEHAVTVDLPMRLFAREDRAAIKRAFDAMHAQRYGTSAPAEPAEIVSLRSTVTGALRKPRLNPIKPGRPAPERGAMRGKRPVYFGDRFRPTGVFDRARLLAGNRIYGPALIEEYASTTVLWPRDRMEVDRYGNLHISVAGAR
jgi:N-methylhydantoinase A